jgi:DNA-binding NtrC family response regulator
MTGHRGSILLVDDEEKIVKALGRALRGAGHQVVETTDPRQALRLLFERPFDVAIVDNVMPETSGLDLIREFAGSTTDGRAGVEGTSGSRAAATARDYRWAGTSRSGAGVTDKSDSAPADRLRPAAGPGRSDREVEGRDDRPQIVMMTAHATVESAIEAMKLGAFDYLQKPFEIDELLVVVDRAVEHQRLRTEYRYLLSERDEQFDHYGIVGRSRAMEEVILRAERVAETKSTVLITGETGTGKELVARAIHDRSAQRQMPLIKVNCAAIPEPLLESELFGHVRGAFTGATTTKKGKFTLADGGTIFLDEIGTMTPALQSKLLRVLQEREFEPLGAERTEKVDVRVIAATNRDLRQMVSDSRFQEDLFYRLNVIPIDIPPLRERREDIPVLVEHFVRKHAQRTGRRIERIDDGVLSALQQYDWPGNVRELENTIERAVVLSAGPVITARSVSIVGVATPQTTGLPSLKLRQNIEWVERETIRRALDSAAGVKKDAAELMGISQRALSYYLAKYRLD